QQARQGDTHAYDALVLRYQDLAFRVAYLVTGEAAEAEDAAQDAFVKAYAALARFRSDAAFRPWLLRIVANEARNRRTAARRRAAPAQRTAWWRLPSLRWGLGLAVIVAALLAGGMALLFPDVRAAVADRLGLGGITITHVPSVPELPATAVSDTPVAGIAPTPA